MPGIAGMISQRPAEECQRLVRAMVGSMRHEPLYLSEFYSVSDLGVYAGWTAHKGSFAASQPFLNEQRDIALIIAGECFADFDTRTNLGKKGHRIEENNDWIVHLYEEEGEQFFEKLNGLFSGVLIDKRLEKAFLFNDRFGVERIYWHENNSSVYLASEAKALLRILPELREFDKIGVAQFLTFGCTLESRTLFRNVNVLPGASLWTFGRGGCQRAKYFSPQAWEAQPALSPVRYAAEFQERFKAVLPRYFESESRMGISLTGGLDTRMIMACRPHCTTEPVCYTFEGPTGETIDTQLAARVAKACGCDHYILRLGTDFFSDFGSNVDRTVYTTDGCLGATGAHEIYLNALARRFAATRLTGNYGSEILRGVSTFKPIGLSSRLLNPDFATLAGSVAKPFDRRESSHFCSFPGGALKAVWKPCCQSFTSRLPKPLSRQRACGTRLSSSEWPS